jgi:hypothetical protein
MMRLAVFCIAITRSVVNAWSENFPNKVTLCKNVEDAHRALELQTQMVEKFEGPGDRLASVRNHSRMMSALTTCKIYSMRVLRDSGLRSGLVRDDDGNPSTGFHLAYRDPQGRAGLLSSPKDIYNYVNGEGHPMISVLAKVQTYLFAVKLQGSEEVIFSPVNREDAEYFILGSSESFTE